MIWDNVMGESKSYKREGEKKCNEMERKLWERTKKSLQQEEAKTMDKKKEITIEGKERTQQEKKKTQWKKRESEYGGNGSGPLRTLVDPVPCDALPLFLAPQTPPLFLYHSQNSRVKIDLSILLTALWLIMNLIGIESKI